MVFVRGKILKLAITLGMAVAAIPAVAQENSEAAPIAGEENSEAAPLDPQAAETGPGGVVFQAGTGDGSPVVGTSVDPATGATLVRTFDRATITCSDLPAAFAALVKQNDQYNVQNALFVSSDIAAPSTVSMFASADNGRGQFRFIDASLLSAALDSFKKHHCASGGVAGPAIIIIVDYSKKSLEPRLYRVDLRNGDGLDQPIVVAHGIGSDNNDDGLADNFSNINNSLMSSLGAVRGAEIYQGRSGRSLRLDGLDASNSEIRRRYIVVHSYRADTRRYFNADLISARGRPGTSEGCFVIPPEKRDWLIDTLAYGGFLYAGISEERAEQIKSLRPAPPPSNATVIFADGTGTPPTN